MSDQYFDDWYSDHQSGLEDAFIKKNDADFIHWCLMAGREVDCPNAMLDYIDVENDKFWEFVKERFGDETQ